MKGHYNANGNKLMIDNSAICVIKPVENGSRADALLLDMLKSRHSNRHRYARKSDKFIGDTVNNLTASPSRRPNTPSAQMYLPTKSTLTVSTDALASITEDVIQSKESLNPKQHPGMQYHRLKKHAVGVVPTNFPNHNDVLEGRPGYNSEALSEKSHAEAGLSAYDRGFTERLVSSNGSRAFTSFTLSNVRHMGRQQDAMCARIEKEARAQQLEEHKMHDRVRRLSVASGANSRRGSLSEQHATGRPADRGHTGHVDFLYNPADPLVDLVVPDDLSSVGSEENDELEHESILRRKLKKKSVLSEVG